MSGRPPSAQLGRTLGQGSFAPLLCSSTSGPLPRRQPRTSLSSPPPHRRPHFCAAPGVPRFPSRAAAAAAAAAICTATRSELEWIELRAAQTPGPGDFDVQAAAPKQAGGRFNTSQTKSALEEVMHRAAQTPGPGSYTPNDSAVRREPLAAEGGVLKEREAEVRSGGRRRVAVPRRAQHRFGGLLTGRATRRPRRRRPRPRRPLGSEAGPHGQVPLRLQADQPGPGTPRQGPQLGHGRKQG